MLLLKTFHWAPLTFNAPHPGVKATLATFQAHPQISMAKPSRSLLLAPDRMFVCPPPQRHVWRTVPSVMVLGCRAFRR